MKGSGNSFPLGLVILFPAITAAAGSGGGPPGKGSMLASTIVLCFLGVIAMVTAVVKTMRHGNDEVSNLEKGLGVAITLLITAAYVLFIPKLIGEDIALLVGVLLAGPFCVFVPAMLTRKILSESWRP